MERRAREVTLERRTQTRVPERNSPREDEPAAAPARATTARAETALWAAIVFKGLSRKKIYAFSNHVYLGSRNALRGWMILKTLCVATRARVCESGAGKLKSVFKDCRFDMATWRVFREQNMYSTSTCTTCTCTCMYCTRMSNVSGCRVRG